jgi:hypothetical protein
MSKVIKSILVETNGGFTRHEAGLGEGLLAKIEDDRLYVIRMGEEYRNLIGEDAYNDWRSYKAVFK